MAVRDGWWCLLDAWVPVSSSCCRACLPVGVGHSAAYLHAISFTNTCNRDILLW